MMTAVLRPRERTTVSPYFPVGGPVPPADLVGREPYLRRLVDRLEDGNHVIVAGSRRLGKAPIILAARRRPKRRGGPTRYVACPGPAGASRLGPGPPTAGP